MPETPFPFLKEYRTKAINAMLLEGLFFHRGDNPSLYADLYERRQDFIDWWEQYFGIELVVRENVAYRRHDNTESDPFTGFSNRNIPNKGRMHFYFSGKDGRLCLLINQRFLYWYETVLRRGNQLKHGEFSFINQDFWDWVQGDLKSFFGDHESMPEIHEIQRATKTVLSALDQYGFIQSIESLDSAEVKGKRPEHVFDKKVVQYLARPALTAYNRTVLQDNPAQFRAAFGLDDEDLEGEEE